MMRYKKEEELYPEVIEWLRRILIQKFKRSKILVYDTSKFKLHNFLYRKKFHTFFPDYLTYEIQVDITGLIKRGEKIKLVFIECKLRPISLKDIAQLLGYSKVANPHYSLIISPSGVSRSIEYLFESYRKYEVLQYNKNKEIIVAKWDENKKDIDFGCIYPKGKFL